MYEGLIRVAIKKMLVYCKENKGLIGRPYGLKVLRDTIELTLL